MTIRGARPSDAEVLALLNRDFNGVDRTTKQIREALQEPSAHETVLVAEEAGIVVGFLCLQRLHSMCYDHPWVEVTELYVEPNRRRRGVGQALVREAEVRAGNMRASGFFLRTNKTNDPVHNLCRRIGLEVAPQVVYRRSYSAALGGVGAADGRGR